MASLQALQERRAYECRLTPDRALQSVDGAEQFLRERGMVTRSADSSLPGFFEACGEDPDKWPWFWELQRRPGVYELRIHRGKSMLLTDETARLADPILRAEIARLRTADADWARLLDHLAAAGPSSADDVRTALALKPKELKAIRSPLERCGAIVSTTTVAELARWDDIFPAVAGEGGIEELVCAGVRAAVVAEEGEVARWFSWRWLIPPGLVQQLVAAGRLERPAPGWVTAPASA